MPAKQPAETKTNKENNASKAKTLKKAGQKAVAHPTGRALFKEDYKKSHPNVTTGEFGDVWKSLDDSIKKVRKHMSPFSVVANLSNLLLGMEQQFTSYESSGNLWK